MENLVYYKGGKPSDPGVYAVRTLDETFGLWEDRFLFWHNSGWWYLNSDQRYRGPVEYWIGPLQRRMEHEREIKGSGS